MLALLKIIAAHPLRDRLPYNAIKFVRADQFGTPLYRVARGKKEMGAPEALRMAFEKLGANCYYCGKWMRPQPLSHDCTRDHLRPKTDGGTSYLHNLVLACGGCNRRKGGSDLISFRAEKGSEYLKALDTHLIRCLAKIRGPETGAK